MPDMKPSQPISILMEEHKIMLQLAEKLVALANKIRKVTDLRYVAEEIHQVEHVTEDFTDSEKHYQREENVLFPIVEKHGITEPPAIMWMEHDQIRELKKKNLQQLVKDVNAQNFPAFKEKLWETAKSLSDLLASHFYKENNILFPAAMSVVTELEWIDVRKEFDEIGYCCFTPPELTAPTPSKAIVAQALVSEGVLNFETGNLTKEQLEVLLNTLPLDVTFVDANDTVQYFNKPDKRFFVRTKAVIGRKVAKCHPLKSLHIVGKIVESFKTGKKNVAEFWITMNNRFLLIRFFAVRDASGKYLGAIEVVQDLTDLKKLEGERRLLDWTD
jgi:DUF438 domain-containing protein